MNYQTFYENTLGSYWTDSKGLRLGQFFMKKLYKHNPELYKSIPPDLDCFYKSELFQDCCRWVQEHWED